MNKNVAEFVVSLFVILFVSFLVSVLISPISLQSGNNIILVMSIFFIFTFFVTPAAIYSSYRDKEYIYFKIFSVIQLVLVLILSIAIPCLFLTLSINSINNDLVKIENLQMKKEMILDDLLLSVPLEDIDYSLQCLDDKKYLENEYQILLKTTPVFDSNNNTCYYTKEYLSEEIEGIDEKIKIYPSTSELEEQKEVLKNTKIKEWWKQQL